METQCSIFKLTSYLVLGTLGISHLPLKLKLQSHLESWIFQWAVALGWGCLSFQHIIGNALSSSLVDLC
jgi:hypothetical protein